MAFRDVIAYMEYVCICSLTPVVDQDGIKPVQLSKYLFPVILNKFKTPSTIYIKLLKQRSAPFPNETRLTVALSFLVIHRGELGKNRSSVPLVCRKRRVSLMVQQSPLIIPGTAR